MRNLLLLLLLANLLYFFWGLFRNEPPEFGVATVDESELGPPLDVSRTPLASASTSVGAVRATRTRRTPANRCTSLASGTRLARMAFRSIS